MNAQDVQIILDYSRDIAQAGELMQLFQTAPPDARKSLENAIAGVALVIHKKAMIQRDMLEGVVVPGSFSQEKLGAATTPGVEKTYQDFAKKQEVKGITK